LTESEDNGITHTQYNKLVLIIDALVKTVKELEDRIESLEKN